MSKRLSKRYIDFDPTDAVNGLTEVDIQEPTCSYTFDDETDDVLSVIYLDGRKITFDYDSDLENITQENHYDTDGVTLLFYYTFTYDATGGITSKTYTAAVLE